LRKGHEEIKLKAETTTEADEWLKQISDAVCRTYSSAEDESISYASFSQLKEAREASAALSDSKVGARPKLNLDSVSRKLPSTTEVPILLAALHHLFLGIARRAAHTLTSP
jgi:hypothetical protein